MKKKWIAILLSIILGTLPAVALASQPAIQSAIVPDIPVVVTWDNYTVRERYEYIDWRMYLDFQLRIKDTIVEEQFIATDVKPFLKMETKAIGPFTITWPANFVGASKMYGRVRWYVNGQSPDRPAEPSIAGDWTYIQDITGTSTVLYFPLGIAPAQ